MKDVDEYIKDYLKTNNIERNNENFVALYMAWGNACFKQCENLEYENEKLKAENAELKARLEKAVELPFEVGSTIYNIHETDEEDKFNPWIDVGKVVSFSFDGKLWIFVRYNSGLTMWYTKDTFDKEVYIIREAAEARLIELKGENRKQ